MENEFNFEQEPSSTKKGLPLIGAIILGITLLFAVVVIALFGRQDAGIPPRSIGGYSISRILTGSMYPELPIDTLIITRQVADHEIEVDSIISFIRTDRRVITHRVVDIYPDHAGSGRPGFRTQGDAVPTADPEIVHSQNVLGEVIWSSAFFGQVFSFTQDNIVLIILIVAAVGTVALVAKKIILVQGNKVRVNLYEESDDNNY